ncbi:hypothetical protein VFPBJ_11567 [Purpureocillium lilacinum]|uniref:Uncharacterized protein n=1 Tax=Purpureocillium lilacinum TaxID=33203 RepID=A0A179F3S3_PURLI|nr:hypothetical protein VFPBJ_11567 [Purpureocillium lilacinum]
MTGSTEGDVESAGPAGRAGQAGFATPRRSSRLVMPKEKGNLRGDDAARVEENRSQTDAVRATNKRVRRSSSTGSEPGSTFVVRSETADEESERALLCRRLIHKLEQEVVNTKEELQKVRQQLRTLQASVNPKVNSQVQSGPRGPRASYADAVRTPPNSQATSPRPLSSTRTNPPSSTDTLNCTIDTSRVE